MNAAIYVRKSTAQTGMSEDARSVERQKARARTYAVQHGWTVADEYLTFGSLYPDRSSNKPQVIHVCTYGRLDGFPSRAIYPFFRRVDASRQGASVYIRHFAAVDTGAFGRKGSRHGWFR